jgi:hypothetical protein
MCAACLAARAQRVTAATSSHVNVALHADCRRVRPGVRSIPYYHNALGDPLWPPKTAGCAESSTEVQHQNVQTKRATCINSRAARFVLCVGGFVSALYHYCSPPEPRLKCRVIRVFRAVRRKCAQIDGLRKLVRMVPEPLRYDQSSNYATCQTAVCPLFAIRSFDSRIRPSPDGAGFSRSPRATIALVRFISGTAVVYLRHLYLASR